MTISFPPPSAAPSSASRSCGSSPGSRERLPHLVALELLGLLEADLADDPHRGDVRLLEQAGRGLRHVLLLRAEAELERVVAVGVLGPDPEDRAGPRLDDGHGEVVAVVAEDLGHADLPPDESLLACHQHTVPCDVE